jgi:hypothetical protein
MGAMVKLTGNVTDPNPSSVALTFNGAMYGSAQADSNGNFSFIGPATLGTVSAVGMDGQQQQSATISTQIASAPPSLTLAVTYGAKRSVTLYGKVTDEAPGGLTVTISGAASGTVTTACDGSFSITLTASQLGQVQATVTDAFRLTSLPASVTLASNPPVITTFQAKWTSLNSCTFSGTVSDESAPGETVQLGGIPELNGVTTTVQSDGTFSITVTLQPHEKGTATAQVTDWWGLESNLALALVG